MSRLFISFSGGETSAFMTWWLLQNARSRYDDIRVLFANTGQEREETLEFVDACDRHFGFNVVWVEADVPLQARRGPRGRVVTFSTASRHGEPFEAAIKKYGIPNRKFPHCTRALKRAPMINYLTETGWRWGTYDTAIGIRRDEIDRVSVNAKSDRIVYPLISWAPMTKPQINAWWSAQPFRLKLKGYEGNCAWCWKKTLRKHFTLLSERPEIYEFPDRMEREYGNVGPEFAKETRDGYRRVFFRGNVSTKQLKDMHAAEKHSSVPYHDDAQIYDPEYDPEYDIGGGCGESCEVFSDYDQGVFA